MQFSYIGPRLKGSMSTFQEWSITPLSSNQYWLPNDVIKIMGNINQGLIDFYRSHLEFQVQVFPQSQPVGAIQIDNSAQSVISQTVILSGQQEVQRIQQYDSLGAYLSDVGFSEYVCQSRDGQGLGFGSIGTNLPGSNATTQPNLMATPVPWNPGDVTATIIQGSPGGSMSPVIAPQANGSGYLAFYQPGTTSNADYPTSYSGMTGGTLQSTTNWVTYPPNGSTDPNTYTTNTGRALCVRSQYLLGPQQNGYPDSPNSLPLQAPFVKNQSWNYGSMLTKGYTPTQPYQTTYSRPAPPLSNRWAPDNSQACGVTGYTKPYCPQFSRGTNEPYLSATLPQVQMVNGQILPEPIPLAIKKFRIPLLSAVCGVLIPPDQFQLIPAQAVSNIILQITLNPYAFFTSGYSDIHQLDTIGMQPQNMQKRRWQFNTFQWVWHLYTFNNAEITGMIKQKLYKGIQISSHYWQLSAQYQLPNGSYVRNSFQIPVNVQSLGQVVCLFLSNEYQTKTFCRKQFRLSNCITQMQLKANGAWYPLQPIQGNAGNPETVDVNGDNWDFYQQILLSNNFLFSTNYPYPKINPRNFAINGRLYDTNAVGTYMSPSLYNQTGNATNMNGFLNSLATVPANINPHTALGQSWFHQNRYVGKAAFPFSFEPYGHSKGFVTGLNTIGYRQFDIIFNNMPVGVFPTDETLLIFTRANVNVRYGPQGIQVLGA